MSAAGISRRRFCATAGAAIAASLHAHLPAGAQSPAASTLTDADWRAIRTVVEAQRAALVADDGERAFGHASPGIRRQFVDAPTFVAMVRRSYSALIDARDAVLLDGAAIDGHVIQPLRLVMPDNTVLVALYTMERQPDGGWKIAGCAIAPSTLRAA